VAAMKQQSETVADVRRDQMLVAASHLIAERGFADTRIADVAERVGASPALVIYYFGTKDSLLTEALRWSERSFYAAVEEMLQETPALRDRIENLVTACLPVADEIPDDWGLWFDLWAQAFRHPEVKKDRVGVIGWCMGGMYALALATEEPGLDAVVAYYGAPPTDAAAIAKIQAPVLGNYGAEDKGPSPEQVKAFEAAMKKAGKKIDVKIYDGAPHAFANPNNPWGGYRETAAKDAWARTSAFFAANLKK